MANEKKTVTIITDRSKSVQSYPITGAWGGSSPDLSVIVAHFYTEYNALPNIIDVEVDEQGQGKPNEGKRISRGDIVREVQTTVVMPPETAIMIGKWLIEKGKQTIEQKKNR